MNVDAAPPRQLADSSKLAVKYSVKVATPESAAFIVSILSNTYQQASFIERFTQNLENGAVSALGAELQVLGVVAPVPKIETVTIVINTTTSSEPDMGGSIQLTTSSPDAQGSSDSQASQGAGRTSSPSVPASDSQGSQSGGQTGGTDEQEQDSSGALVGGIVGASISVCLLMGACYLFKKSKQKSAD